jgi:hypothetical protein
MAPQVPTLEEIWEGRAEIMLRGPLGRTVKCRVSLFEKDNSAAVIAKQLPPIALPFTAEQWRVHFDKHFRDKKDVQSACDAARVCELDFSAEELGAFTVRCEREFTPLRWALREHRREYFVSLFDDSGEIKRPAVTRFAFETPLLEEPLELASEYHVSAAGGMYVARVGEFKAAILVPPVANNFEDLRCFPRIEKQVRSVDSVLRTLGLARLWGQGRLPRKMLSATRRRDVLQALTRHLSQLFSGDTWAEAELASLRATGGIAHLKCAISKRREDAMFGSVLEHDYTALTNLTIRERVRRVAGICTKFLSLPSKRPLQIVGKSTIIRRWPSRADDPKWIVELAFRLASDPSTVEEWAGECLRAGVTRLLDLPTLARATRFLVVAMDQHLKSRTANGELYAGWIWA